MLYLIKKKTILPRIEANLFCATGINCWAQVSSNRKTPALESLFIKMRFQHRYFPVKFAKFLKTRILNICQRLLLCSMVSWCCSL